MPSLSPQERLQPALLDRLIDDEPEKGVESREARMITVRRLREAVLRDLSWLLNSAAPTSEELEVSAYPQVRSSVVCYGVPPMAGNTASGISARVIEDAIRSAITRFEPRMVPQSLQVKALFSEQTLDHHNQIQVEIRGSLWSVPVPIEMLLRTSLDLESGQVEVRDES